jgi:hypothetical protein
MIWQRLRLDPYWKAIPMLAVMFPASWWFAGHFIDPAVAGGMTEAMLVGILIMWILFPPFRQRYTLLDVTLPITGRQLFLSRVVLMLALVWLPLLASVAASLAMSGHQGLPESLPMFEGGALVTVGLLLVQTFRAGEINPPVWLTLPIGTAGFFLLTRMAQRNLRESGGLTLAVLAGCAMASAALFLKGWAEVPKSFQLAPNNLEIGDAVAIRSERAGDEKIASPWWPVFRALYLNPSKISPWLFSIAFLGFFAYRHLGPLSVLLFWSAPLGYPAELRWLLPLPISPRKLFWLSSFHSVSAILVGLLVATVVSFESSNPADVKLEHGRAEDGLFGQADNSGTMNVSVPSGYWRWASGGSAPMLDAPWGENYRPETQKWLGLLFYNPYSVDRAASQQYLEWQFLRATQAVYGRAVSPSEAETLARMKTIKRQTKAQVIMLAFALMFYLAQICVVCLVWGKHLFPYAGMGLRYFLSMAPMLLVFVLIIASPPVGSSGSFLFDSLVLHLVRILPGSLWVLALIAVAPMTGLYWLAEKLWGEMEFRQMGWQIEAQVRQRQQKLCS